MPTETACESASITANPAPGRPGRDSRAGRGEGASATPRPGRPGILRPKRPAAPLAAPGPVPSLARPLAADPNPPLEAAPLFRARITAADGEAFLARGPGGRTLPAKRAAGCLLLPEPGDLVLCHGGGDGLTYVVSVLERAGTRAVLDVGADLTVRGGETMRFEAKTVAVEAGEALSLEAPDLSLTGVRGRLGFLRLSVLADALDAKLRGLTSVVEDASALFGGLSLKARTAIRLVETEMVRAGRLRQLVRERFFVRAGRAAILADEDVSIDADKINLG